MQAKHYLIILLFALIGLSNNLQAQDAKERAVVEKALKVWLENEKIKCANHFDEQVIVESIMIYQPFEKAKEEESWIYLGHIETHLLSILNKRSIELSKEQIPLGEIAKQYYTTLDSCIIHLPTIMKKDKSSIFKVDNLLSITNTLKYFSLVDNLEYESRKVIDMYKIYKN